VLGAPPAPLPPPVPTLVRQEVPGGVGAPAKLEPPTRSNIGGRHSLAPVGGGQPLAGQLSTSGTHAVITVVSASQVHPAGQSVSAAQLPGSAGA
jgi:hypothetical protein